MVQLDLSVLRLMCGRRIAAAFAVGTIAGCALSPAPTHDAVVAEALPTGTAIPSAWRADARSAPVAAGWLQSFNDPVLNALVTEAIANNLDLRQAAENVTMAQQAVIVVGSQLLPQIGAVLGGRAARDADHDGTFTTNIAYVGVAWELDVWGRLRSQRAAAEAGAQATALDYAYARESLAAMVAKVWYLTSETRQLLALAERTVAIYSEQLNLVNIRRSAGKDSNLDVVETQAKLESAQSELEAARQAYGESRRALEVLLGRYPAAEIEAEAAFAPLPLPPGTGVPASLLQRRPDILAAERKVLAQFRQEQAARLALLPDFSISFAGGHLGDQVLSVLHLNPWLTSATVGVSIPIYEGGALRAQVAIATAQQVQAVAHYGAVVLAAFREVEDALANEQLLLKRLPLDESALQNRTEAVRIATLQYVAGRRDLLWVSNLQSGQLDNQAALIKLRALQRLNRIALYLALGGV